MSDDELVEPFGTTPAGLPYPAPTDPVAQGAANIQALAEAVDTRLPGAGCRVKRLTNIGMTSGATLVIPWDGEDYDPDAMHDPAVNPDRVVIKKAGLYLAVGTVVVQSSSLAGWRIAATMKNGGYIDRGGTHVNDAAGAIAPVVQSVSLVRCAVNDYLGLAGYQNVGGPLFVLATDPSFAMATSLTVVRLGP